MNTTPGNYCDSTDGTVSDQDSSGVTSTVFSSTSKRRRSPATITTFHSLEYCSCRIYSCKSFLKMLINYLTVWLFITF